MELTAKEILEKHGIHELPENEVKDILAAIKEACTHCIDRAKGYYTDAEYITGESKEEIINSLFPESK